MNRYYILIILLFSSVIIKAQNEPNWINTSWRTTQYPNNTFLVGYSEDVKSSDETIAESLQRIKNMAIGDLAKSVVSSIKTVSQNYAQSTLYGDQEEIKKTFETQTQSESDAQINNIKVETFHNKETNFIYAFAFVNRYEVIGYYKANINMNIQQIEGFIKTANELIAISEKTKAQEELQKTIPLFAKNEYAQGLLTAVDKNIDDSGLQMKKSVELRNTVIQKLTELEQGIYIYITCDAILFDHNDKTLENKTKAGLSENGCSFTNDSNQADYIINIKAKARKNIVYMDIYSSYVDAEITLTKVFNQKIEYENKITKKGNSMSNYEGAAIDAFDELATILVKDLLTRIKK